MPLLLKLGYKITRKFLGKTLVKFFTKSLIRLNSDMGNIFPKWLNWLPLQIVVGVGIIGTLVSLAVAYTFTPKYTRVGYTPTQPIPFDHSIHAGQLGMDCRYCHSFVDESPHSNIPAAQVCWNCHGAGKVASDSPSLEPLRAAMDTNYEGYTGEPIKWVQVHETPDYAYFNHSAHVNRGVSCVECHGKINEMEVVSHDKPLSMSFCLDCHRAPEKALRPIDQITNLDFTVADVDEAEFYSYLEEKTEKSVDELKQLSRDWKLDWGQELMGMHLKEAWSVHPPQDCTTCHR